MLWFLWWKSMSIALNRLLRSPRFLVRLRRSLAFSATGKLVVAVMQWFEILKHPVSCQTIGILTFND